ncbi:MAG: UDP-N-acetylmuramoyl-tripeptide--D-alanyl-D-alanine ligase, partial [Micrococcales bacterium]
MIALTLGEIEQLTGGRIVGNPATLITGSVETDSRLVGAGSLFFAKPGEVTDGHNFVAAAKGAGAVAAVVERQVAVDIPQLVVGNVVTALGLLAKGVLARVRQGTDGTGIKVIGVTGSNGKTTTKSMLNAILSKQGETVSPIESYNNEVGAPISVLKITHQTEYLVAELGAGGLGSIRYLAEITQPDFGVVLKVGMAHAGEFGGIENTRKIKAELVQQLTANATAVLNQDDSMVASMAELTAAKKVWFGTTPDADYWASDYELTLAGTSFLLHWPDDSTNRVTLQIIGEHHVINALAAASVADQIGIKRTEIVEALEGLPLAERWRMQLTTRADGVVVINDAYNASPDSTKAALQTLAQLGRQTGRRTVAVIGEMAELGQFSVAEHDAIGRLA